MRVVGYARVSTRRQADGDSIEAQDEAIRGWAGEHGHDFAGLHADEGRSGALDEADRPALLGALSAIEAGEADALVVHRLDRLARALHVQEAVLARVWAAGGDAWEVVGDRPVLRDDPADPMRTFVRQVMGAAAQLERGMTVARMQGGRRRKAATDGYIGGRVPYGWDLVGEHLVSSEAEQRVIARMARARRGGRTFRAIAEQLNGDGVPAKGGGAWRHTSVRAVLRKAP